MFQQDILFTEVKESDHSIVTKPVWDTPCCVLKKCCKAYKKKGKHCKKCPKR